MPTEKPSVEEGAANLLVNCASIQKNERLLIIREERGLGCCDEDIVIAVAEAGSRIGAGVTVAEVPFDPRAKAIPAEVRALMHAADQTVFLARIGDQLRFSDMGSGKRPVVSCALDVGMLGPAYGTVDYRAFDQLKGALNRSLCAAHSIHVTCPADTNFNRTGPGSGIPPEDDGLNRFPMPEFTPIPAARFSGTVSPPGFLVGTGSMYYGPYAVEYDGALFAAFEYGRITGFTGNQAAVELARSHFRFVAEVRHRPLFRAFLARRYPPGMRSRGSGLRQLRTLERCRLRQSAAVAFPHLRRLRPWRDLLERGRSNDHRRWHSGLEGWRPAPRTGAGWRRDPRPIP